MRCAATRGIYRKKDRRVETSMTKYPLLSTKKERGEQGGEAYQKIYNIQLTVDRFFICPYFLLFLWGLGFGGWKRGGIITPFMRRQTKAIG